VKLRIINIARRQGSTYQKPLGFTEFLAVSRGKASFRSCSGRVSQVVLVREGTRGNAEHFRGLNREREGSSVRGRGTQKVMAEIRHVVIRSLDGADSGSRREFKAKRNFSSVVLVVNRGPFRKGGLGRIVRKQKFRRKRRAGLRRLLQENFGTCDYVRSAERERYIFSR